MSHKILIPFYYTFLAVIDYASSDLVKLTKCILNNDLSIFLIINCTHLLSYQLVELALYWIQQIKYVFVQ